MNKLEKLMNEKYTENGDKAYKSTGNNLTDLFFMTPYFEKLRLTENETNNKIADLINGVISELGEE